MFYNRYARGIQRVAEVIITLYSLAKFALTINGSGCERCSTTASLEEYRGCRGALLFAQMTERRLSKVRYFLIFEGDAVSNAK